MKRFSTLAKMILMLFILFFSARIAIGYYYCYAWKGQFYREEDDNRIIFEEVVRSRCWCWCFLSHFSARITLVCLEKTFLQRGRWGRPYLSKWSEAEKFSVLCRKVVGSGFDSGLGKSGATKSDEFSEKFQTAFDPAPSFLENYIANFFQNSWPKYRL